MSACLRRDGSLPSEDCLLSFHRSAFFVLVPLSSFLHRIPGTKHSSVVNLFLKPTKRGAFVYFLSDSKSVVSVWVGLSRYLVPFSKHCNTDIHGLQSF